MNISVSFKIVKLLEKIGWKLPYTIEYLEELQGTNNYIESIPTIADVVCWLCDKHQIWITAHPEYCNGTLEWIFNFQFLNDNDRTWKEQEVAYKIFFEDTYKSKEEAYEVCIEYTLNNLI